MDVNKLLADLRSQRDLLLQAIAALERLALGGGRRRGRPPKWAQAATSDEAQPAKKRTLSPEARKRMAEAQKKRWAAARKQQA